MKKKNILIGAAIGAVVVGVIIYAVSPKIKEKRNAIKLERALEQKERNAKIDAFNAAKEEFLERYSVKAIRSVTLSNDLIEDLDDKSYLYSKLDHSIDQIKSFDYSQEDKYKEKTSEFVDLYNVLDPRQTTGIWINGDCVYTDTDTASKKANDEVIKSVKDTIKAQIYYMRKVDADKEAALKEKLEDIKKKTADQLAYNRELEKIKENNRNQEEMLNAKLRLAEVKFKTVAAMMKDSDKKVNANVSLKSDIFED